MAQSAEKCTTRPKNVFITDEHAFFAIMCAFISIKGIPKEFSIHSREICRQTDLVELELSEIPHTFAAGSLFDADAFGDLRTAVVGFEGIAFQLLTQP